MSRETFWRVGDQSKCTHHECTCMSLGALDNHSLELLFIVVTFNVENGQYILDNRCYNI